MKGIPIAGKVFIEVGPEGEVYMISSSLRYTSTEILVPILSPGEAINMLQAGKGLISDGPSWNATAYIDSIELVYWQGVIAENYPYIMPVYILQGQAIADKKKAMHWSARLEAVRPELLY